MRRPFVSSGAPAGVLLLHLLQSRCRGSPVKQSTIMGPLRPCFIILFLARFAVARGRLARASARPGPTERGAAIRTISALESPKAAETFWDDIYSEGVPVLFKGLVNNTSLMKMLSPEGLRSGPHRDLVYDVNFRKGHGDGPRNHHVRRYEKQWTFAQVEEELVRRNKGGPVLGATMMQEFTSDV